MQSDDIIIKDLVLIGGGHSHVGVIKNFAMSPLPGLRITLITKVVHTPYSGMLPGLIAGHFSFDDCHIDLRPLCEWANVTLIHAEVNSIDFDKKQVFCADQRPAISFDIVAINTGSTPDISYLQQFKQLVTPVKPIEDFLSQLAKMIALPPKQLIVVGGGAGGVELAFSLDYKLNQVQQSATKITLVTQGDKLLKQHNHKVQDIVLKLLKQRGIEIVYSAKVESVQEQISEAGNKNKRLMFSQNNKQKHLIADEIIWATYASAPKWISESGLEVDEGGFIKVNTFLQSPSYEYVFATGDIATIIDHKRPKSGVFAVRQGLPLYQNLSRFALKQPLKNYIPQKTFLNILNCGNRYSIASWSFLALSGKWLWFVKRWIDVAFMEKFSDFGKKYPITDDKTQKYQQIASASMLNDLQQNAIRCGGCGAKVSSSILQAVMTQILSQQQGIIQEQPAGIYLSCVDQDDAAVFSVPENKLLVQSIDYFPAFISDPYLFGKIAVIHALGDLYAMGAKAHSAQLLVSLPYMQAEKQQSTLLQLMSGVMEQLVQEKVTLLGGHSNESKEMACGLSVNGLVDKKKWLNKKDLQVGQLLILTKSLGSGILLAANMRRLAKGRWIEKCIDNMLLSNAKASEIFSQFDCTACTDVTGFGLVGHLHQLLRPANLSAQLYLEQLPFLSGVKDCLQLQVYSSLYQENYHFNQYVDSNLQQHSLYPLLFDPQTAGGLLLAVDDSRSSALIASLQQLGYNDACVVGKVVANADDKEQRISII